MLQSPCSFRQGAGQVEGGVIVRSARSGLIGCVLMTGLSPQWVSAMLWCGLRSDSLILGEKCAEIEQDCFLPSCSPKAQTFLAWAKKLVFVLTVLAGRTMVDYPRTLLTNKAASSRDKIWVLTWLHFMSKGIIFYSVWCPFIMQCISFSLSSCLPK